MNSDTSPSLLSWSPKKMSGMPVASPPRSWIGKYVDVPIMSGAKRPPKEVTKEDAPPAKSKPLSPFVPSVVPIKTFIPTVAHPAGHMLNIVGIARTDRGRKCDAHDCCGDVVKEDVIVRLRRKQHVWKNKATGKNEENTIYEAVWVTEGIDMCKVGFLPKAYVEHGSIYDGVLCQILDRKLPNDTSATVRRNWHCNCGYAIAVIISPLNLEIDVLPIGGKKGKAFEECSDCEVVGVKPGK